MMPKLGLIRGREPSNWNSCRTILNNLRAFYLRDTPHDFEVVEYTIPRNDDIRSCLALAKEINRVGLSHLIFIDHEPHPFVLLRCLDFIAGDRRPLILCHLYGDMISYLPSWQKLTSLTSRFRIHLIAPTAAQSKLTEALLGAATCSIWPFLSPAENFRFDENQRRAKRQREQWRTEDFVVLYTGRLVREKCALELIHILRALANTKPGRNIHLVLVGSTPERHDQFMSGPIAPGEYFESIRHAKEAVREPNLTVDIRPPQGQLELDALYNAADLFCSLSTFHLEDFGMSPLEAMGRGLPTVLTAWGGYNDFIDAFASLHVSAIPATLSPNGPCFDEKTVVTALAKVMSKPLTADERSRFAAATAAHYGIGSHEKTVASLLDQLERRTLANLVETSVTRDLLNELNPIGGRLFPTFNQSVRSQELYRLLYTSYLSPNRDEGSSGTTPPELGSARDSWVENGHEQ